VLTTRRSTTCAATVGGALGCLIARPANRMTSAAGGVNPAAHRGPEGKQRAERLLRREQLQSICEPLPSHLRGVAEFAFVAGTDLRRCSRLLRAIQ